MPRVDVALEEFKALRAEILVHQQAKATLVSVALTATAAIGAIAFATEAQGHDRLEILLILPIVLCGLGLAYLSHSHSCHLAGHYIRQRLWPQLQDATPANDSGAIASIPSWEASIHEARDPVAALVTPRGYLSWLPGFFIFGVPSIAALVLNREKAPDWCPFFWNPEGGALSTAWSIDALAILVSSVLMIVVGFSSGSDPFPAGSRNPRAVVEPQRD